VLRVWVVSYSAQILLNIVPLLVRLSAQEDAWEEASALIQEFVNAIKDLKVMIAHMKLLLLKKMS